MTVKELIKHLRTFDENHHIKMEIETECGYVEVGSDIDDVQFKNGNCILHGCDFP